MYRYIVFDVETPNRYNNRMSAIGINVVEDGTIKNSFFSYVNPETIFDYFNTQLTDLCEYYGIELDHHQADSDSRAAAEILLRYFEAGADEREFIRTYRLG